MRRYTITLNIK